MRWHRMKNLARIGNPFYVASDGHGTEWVVWWDVAAGRWSLKQNGEHVSYHETASDAKKSGGGCRPLDGP